MNGHLFRLRATNSAGSTASTAAILFVLGDNSDFPLNLRAEGPGVVRFGAPRPHLSGQQVEVIAEPIPGARFLRWNDGRTEARRVVTVGGGTATYTGYFEDMQFPTAPTVPGIPLDATDPGDTLVLGVPELVDGGLMLMAEFPGRHGFRLFHSRTLSGEALGPVPFALPGETFSSFENIAGPGRVEILFPLPAEDQTGFFQLQLDNGLTVPVLFSADVERVAPGGDLLLFGRNLAGEIEASSGNAALESAPVNSEIVSVRAPTRPGPAEIRLRVNNVQAIGRVNVTVANPGPGDPALDLLPSNHIPQKGILRLSGENFGPEAKVWWNGEQLPVVGRSTDQREIYVRMPPTGGQGRISVTSGGARSAAITVNLVGLPYAAAALPVGVYAFQAGAFKIPYTAPVLPVPIFTSRPGAFKDGYTPPVLPVRVEVP